MSTSLPLRPISALDRAFFARNPRRVARELLGKVLVRERGKLRLTGRIVEVEAYLGESDPAAHAAAGNTARTSILFGPPGYAYVYFIYGNHYCLNVSCEPAGKAGSVLFRALEPLAGIEAMALSPRLGDFNEDLHVFGLEALRAALRIQLAPEDVDRFLLPATARG